MISLSNKAINSCNRLFQQYLNIITPYPEHKMPPRHWAQKKNIYIEKKFSMVIK